MSKRILAILCTLAMVILVSASAFAADPVWQLTADEVKAYIDSGQSSDYLQNSGDGAAHAAADGAKLTFKASRPNDYSVVDLKVQDLCDPGVEYTLVAHMTAKAEANLRLVETSGYTSLAEQTGTDVTLTYKFKDPTTRIRFQTSDTTEFTIVSAVLWEGDPPAAGAATTANPKTGDTSIIFIALTALALAACGAFVLSRKAKSN